MTEILVYGAALALAWLAVGYLIPPTMISVVGIVIVLSLMVNCTTLYVGWVLLHVMIRRYRP